MGSVVTLTFASGTLEIRAWPPSVNLPSGCTWDDRTNCHRSAAAGYAEVVRALVASKTPYEDRARAYPQLAAGARVHRDPRPYQSEALAAWNAHQGRGVVVLPTGAGKSHVAVLAIEAKRRSALVVAPTLDLVRQWFDPLTVTTYDSAFLHMEHLGCRFGVVVFDECHHLPSAAYALAARACIAPFRLGLTATLERADGREAGI